MSIRVGRIRTSHVAAGWCGLSRVSRPFAGKRPETWLEELAPHAPISQYQHNRTGEDNGDAHLKRQVMGWEVVVTITLGRLDLGLWEQIFYGEFDGRRRSRVLVNVIGD